MFSKEEIKEIKDLANTGALEIVKKDMYAMQMQMLLKIRKLGKKKEPGYMDSVRDLLTVVNTLDIIMVRIDSYKDPKEVTKEVGGRTVNSDTRTEQGIEIEKWLNKKLSTLT
ncbi:hypothetical protein DRO38_03585, partial [Candidatus Bathyarchaeota archaeon]